ncbi:hypothetical protein BH09BAC1_BH09BAC1_29390 [soil metagenome]
MLLVDWWGEGSNEEACHPEPHACHPEPVEGRERLLGTAKFFT